MTSKKTTSSWQSFSKTFLSVLLGTLIVCATLIIFINPLNNIPWMPNDGPIFGKADQFAYPGLARHKRFDSALFGRSTIRALNPKDLNEKLGGSFVNLAIKASTAYEQYQIMNVFLKDHPAPKKVIIGVDDPWCTLNNADVDTYLTPFPEWLYDNDPWNDMLYLLNLKMTAIALKALMFQYLGFAPEKDKYDLSGFSPSVPDNSQYNPQDVEKKLKEGTAIVQFMAQTHETPEVVKGMQFTRLPLLHEIIKKLPQSTSVIIVFPPYFYTMLPPQGSGYAYKMGACKQAVAHIAQQHPNSHVIDFMIPSNITTKKENYWDGLHYTKEIAKAMVEDIAQAMERKTSRPSRYLYIN